MRIGVLVSGGDCPGLNAAIRGAVLRGVDVLGFEMIGFMDGWRGVIEGEWIPLDRAAVRGISPLGGTILGTSRVSPLTPEVGVEGIRAKLAEYDVDGLITIGGNGTQTVARILSDAGIPAIGLPKTIDNDLAGTDYTFGFDTAVSIATEAIDRLRTTGESHRRCMVLEVMGRDAGWIALHAGMAGGAQVILLPEYSESLDQVCAWVESVRDRDRAPLVVVAEGFKLEGMEHEVTRAGLDGFGRPRLGGIGEVLAPLIEERTGMESRATVLGHIQRGGVPTAFDRVLATRAGIAAADAAAAGEWGTMAALHGTRLEMVPLAEAVGRLNTVPEDRYEEVRRLFG
ncbi:6-phosphofructokinase [Leucobacter sp. OLJS4]|uniref:6-phosphofructokinase n=1 Tax=unclassified Leucobacter TaxID=2621730 RepID=UPI000C175E94|nr:MULTISPECIES: ATP-dependent 6-phosphofructokinase [unclassified Leucobacter]PIJ52558.1 6-phosphofructokinase [Leucobacter sp. OLES1]PII84493.1 6-phosphofructokinase [Leucobacter sp. OLCALW19]PII88730.1 6-phosphofructokinase [Leucobacter sp. OLTLW20]PII90912.1 6-phosphofructokinase [Leucobacter sp. OLAS13]PII97659.1 6-phosphofructokinase [Leucobacter sp. OLDS2]